jgi:hypothetical protein
MTRRHVSTEEVLTWHAERTREINAHDCDECREGSAVMGTFEDWAGWHIDHPDWKISPDEQASIDAYEGSGF